MLKARIEAGILKDVMTGVALLIDEGIITVDKEGMHFIASDRAVVCVVGFDIPAKAFESFEADEDELALNLTYFFDVLKRASPKEKITLNLMSGKLEVEIQDEAKRTFTVPLLSLEATAEEVPPIENLEFKATAELDTKLLQKAIEDADIVAESVVFENSPLGKFCTRAEGDIANVESETVAKIIGTGKSRYPLDYLKKILKGGISEKVKLSYGTDAPLRADFETEKAKVFYVVAPRVEETEEPEEKPKNNRRKKKEVEEEVEESEEVED